MTKSEFNSELAKLLEVDASAITERSSLSDFEEWNSLTVISFMAMVDKKLHVVVAAKAIAGAKTIADLQALVSESLQG